jgi:nitrate reductase delta subunit
MSLLLFEHIHGESRDRGQAMVDLLSTYREGRLRAGAKQLPDYLPVVLEYLSLAARRRGPRLARACRPHPRTAGGSRARAEQPLRRLFEALVELAKGRVDLDLLRRRVATEERDDTPEAMDKVWEEEAIRFGVEAPSEDCNPPTRLPSVRKRNEPAVTP